jgi:glutamine amidotransferase
MCRFVAYRGAPLILDELLYQPKNSLVHQSYHALERKDPVNADGFGVGWYMPDINPTPALFVDTKPAWNNRNLRSLAPRISSSCIFAHVRAAVFGAVIESNCHPFQYDKLLMMHNGTIRGFHQIRRKLRSRLSDETYDWISGTTDSEHFFALFLSHLLHKKKMTLYDEHQIIDALLIAINNIKEILNECSVDEHFSLNIAVTDGQCVVAARYHSDPEKEPPTLYYSEKGCYQCREGTTEIIHEKSSKQGILIVSERLTDQEEDWHKIPSSHFVIVTQSLGIKILPIRL